MYLTNVLTRNSDQSPNIYGVVLIQYLQMLQFLKNLKCPSEISTQCFTSLGMSFHRIFLIHMLANDSLFTLGISSFT